MDEKQNGQKGGWKKELPQNRREGSYFQSRLFNLALVLVIIFGYDQMLEKKQIQASLQASEKQVAKMEQLIAKASENAGKQILEAGGGQDGAAGENMEGNKKDTPAKQAGGYKDGIYKGSGQGFGGDIDVSVTIENKKITEIEVLSASGEDETYLETAKQVFGRMQEAQTADVEAVSGATFSSTGIIEAVKTALEKAVWAQ